MHLKDIKPRESACCYWTLSQILGIPNVNARKAYLQTELSRQFKISLRRKTIFCSNNMNINIIATSKVRQDVEEFSRLAAKVGADFTAGHHVGVAAAAALVKRVSCALSFLSPFIQFQFASLWVLPAKRQEGFVYTRSWRLK